MHRTKLNAAGPPTQSPPHSPRKEPQCPRQWTSLSQGSSPRGTTFSNNRNKGRRNSCARSAQRSLTRTNCQNKELSCPDKPDLQAPALDSCWHGDAPDRTTTSAPESFITEARPSLVRYSTGPRHLTPGWRCRRTAQQSSQISQLNCPTHSTCRPTNGSNTIQNDPSPSNKEIPSSRIGRLLGPAVRDDSASNSVQPIQLSSIIL